MKWKVRTVVCIQQNQNPFDLLNLIQLVWYEVTYLFMYYFVFLYDKLEKQRFTTKA